MASREIANPYGHYDVSKTNDDFVPPVTRHREYYFDDGNLVVQVENTLFRVIRSTFIRHSPIFKDLFTLPSPPGAAVEGSKDECPLYFSGIPSTDFERLLWILYPPVYGTYKAVTAEEWTSILSVSTRWEFADIRALAIRQLQTLDISPVDKILIAREYDIRGRWTLTAYTALCERAEALTIAEASRLGLETAMRIAQMREQLRGGGRSIGGGYYASTRSATSRRTGQPAGPRAVRSERTQWDIGRTYLGNDVNAASPVRSGRKSVGRFNGAGGVSATSRLVAEAFGLNEGMH